MRRSTLLIAILALAGCAERQQPPKQPVSATQASPNFSPPTQSAEEFAEAYHEYYVRPHHDLKALIGQAGWNPGVLPAGGSVINMDGSVYEHNYGAYSVFTMVGPGQLITAN
jgi:hypothetical protein